MLYAAGLVVVQARKNGFTIRNRDELAEKKATLGNVLDVNEVATPNKTLEKSDSREYV